MSVPEPTSMQTIGGTPSTVPSYVELWGLPVCLAVALALRGIVVVVRAGELTGDRDAYMAIAAAVAAGHGYADPQSLAPTAFRPPLYPLQLAGLMLVLPAAAAVAVSNLVWGAISVWATWRAGHWLGLGGLSGLAALLVAVDPMLLLYSAQPMTEVTCAGLVALLAYWMVRRDQSERARQFGAGLVFGALVQCRPTFWPLAGLAAAGYLWSRIAGRRQHSMPGDGVAAHGVPWRVLAGALVLVAPWVIRNQWAMGSPILTTTHGGYTLLLANNPVFYGEVVNRGWGSQWPKASFDRWQQQLQADLAAQLGPRATEMDRDRWQAKSARRFIASQPAQFAKAAWYRIRSLWSTMPQGEAAAATDSRLVQLAGWFYTAEFLACVAGLVGLGIRRAERPEDIAVRRWWPVLALILTVQLVHMVYWTNARMRAPIVPLISLLAVAGLRPLNPGPLTRPSQPAAGTCSPGSA